MSFLSSVGSGIRSLFGGNQEKTLDMVGGIGEFIDESFHTDEEKSNAKIKLLDLKIKWANATQGQNLARRYCAMAFGLNFIFTFQICVFLAVYGFFTGIKVSKTIESIIGLASAFQLGYIMLTIITFYFGKEIVLHGRDMMANKK